MGLETLLEKYSSECPESPAILFEDRTITYGELDVLSNRVANAFRRLEVLPGDRVGIMLPNVPEFVYTFFGVLKCGAVAVPFNTMYKGGEVVHILKDSGAKALVALSSFATLINEALDHCENLKHVIYTGERSVTFAEPNATVFAHLLIDSKTHDVGDLYRIAGRAMIDALAELGVEDAWYSHRGSLRVNSGEKIGGFLVSEIEGIHAVNAQLFTGRFDAHRFMDVIWVPPEIRDKVAEPLSSVEQETGSLPEFCIVRDAIVRSVEKVFGARVESGRMTRDEMFGFEKLRSQAFRTRC